MAHRWRHAISALCLVAICVLGCSGNSDLIPVSGKVNFQGKPLPNGGIMFFPQRGHPQSVSLDPDGKYEIQLPPGEYRVTVSTGIDVPAGWKEGDPLPPPSNIVLPAKYSQHARTELRVTVDAKDAPQTKDFLLN